LTIGDWRLSVTRTTLTPQLEKNERKDFQRTNKEIGNFYHPTSRRNA
jgi:hypothetical protein